MLYLSIALFALAAILGAVMLVKWFNAQGASKAVIYSHGVVAATALTLLVLYWMAHPEDFPTVVLILFGIGAVGGFYLFFNERSTGKRPVGIAVVHALLGVSAFLLLLAFALK